MHIFRLQLQRVIEIHVKLNKEDKGEGGGAGLVVRASDSEARVRVSLLTRVTMLCPLARQIYSPKVLVIPMKRRPRPNMSQKSRTYDLLAFAVDPRYIPEHFGIFFRSLTTAGDNRERCQDTRLGQYSYLAHDRLFKFMANTNRSSNNRNRDYKISIY